MEFEIFAVLKMTFLFEVVENKGMNGGNFLKRLCAPEICHRSLSPTERLM